MSIRKRLIVVLVVLVGGLGMMGCGSPFPNDFESILLEGDVEKVKSSLEENPSLINHKTQSGQNALHVASLNGRTEVVKLLIDRGVKVDRKDNLRQTPLWVAAKWRRKDTVEVLLTHGADVNIKGNMEESILFELIITRKMSFEKTNDNSKEIMKLLIANGADVNYRRAIRDSLLYWAVGRGYNDAVEILLEGGAKIYSDENLLFYAISVNEDVVALLIANGADVNVKDNRGDTPLAFAIRRDKKEIIELLKKHGAKE